jgi:hypothetical protein
MCSLRMAVKMQQRAISCKRCWRRMGSSSRRFNKPTTPIWQRKLKTSTQRRQTPVAFWGSSSECWPRRQLSLRYPKALTSSLSSARTTPHQSKQLAYRATPRGERRETGPLAEYDEIEHEAECVTPAYCQLTENRAAKAIVIHPFRG